MNLNSSDDKSRIDVNYVSHQPQKNIQKPKDVNGIYVEIDKNGKVENYKLSETQVRMLNRGEDILLIKPINLDKTKYKKIIYDKNSEIIDDNKDIKDIIKINQPIVFNETKCVKEIIKNGLVVENDKLDKIHQNKNEFKKIQQIKLNKYKCMEEIKKIITIK